MSFRYFFTLILAPFLFSFFFFNDTATTEIYTLSLHDALPIYAIGDEVAGASRVSRTEPSPLRTTRKEDSRRRGRVETRTLRKGRVEAKLVVQIIHGWQEGLPP